MLGRIRDALAPLGGVQALIALGAIAWGLGRLQSIADERQAHLDHIAAATTANEEALTLVRNQLDTYIDHEGRPRFRADGSPVGEPSAADARAAHHAEEVPS